MNELIKIESREGIKTVNARELHAFLEVGKVFGAWIADRIEQFDFSEGQDFIVLSDSGKNPHGGRPTKDYHLTLDMAKELSMVERNEKGKQARLYFIECEKIAQQAPTISLPQTYKEALEHLLLQVNINEAQAKQIEQDRPKVAFAEQVEASSQTVEFSVFAKAVSRSGKFIIGRNTLYSFLREKRVLMDGFKSKNLPYQRYIDAGWFEVVERSHENAHSNGPRVYFITLITGKGQIAITKMLAEHFSKAA